MNTGIDGGMNKVFAAKLPDGNTGLSEGGDQQACRCWRCRARRAPSPSHVNPPKPKLTPEEEPVVAGRHRRPASRRQRLHNSLRNPKAGSPASPARSASAAPRRRRAHRRLPRKPKAESKPAPASSYAPLPRHRSRLSRSRPPPSRSSGTQAVG
jgi:hypothetical protein